VFGPKAVMSRFDFRSPFGLYRLAIGGTLGEVLGEYLALILNLVHIVSFSAGNPGSLNEKRAT